MRIHRSVHAGLVTVAVAAGTLLATPSVHAAPPGKVNCTPVPISSRLEVTCVNTAPEPATASMFALCSNARTLNENGFPIAPDSTVLFTQDCGDGATLISWNVKGETVSERAERQRREQSEFDDKEKKRREQSDQDDKARENERKRRAEF